MLFQQVDEKRIAGSSNAPYRWSTHKITVIYIVAHSVSNGGNDDILKEDNIANVVHLLNEKSQFVRAIVTDTDVRIFFKSNEQSIVEFVNYATFLM